MLLMAKRSEKTAAKGNPAAVGKRPGRARDIGDVESLTVELEPQLVRMIEQFIDSNRPKTTKRGVVEWALEEFFKKRGLME